MKRFIPLLISLLLCFPFVSGVALAEDIPGSRLFPETRVLLFQGGVQIGEFTNEAPCPEDVFLSCDGKCAIKLDNLVLMAEDKSIFSVSTRTGSRFLNVKQGKIYFGLSELSSDLVFLTPEGGVAAVSAFLNASSSGGQGIIEGYVNVSEITSEVGVISGGGLYMQTRNEQKMLRSGNRMILLAQGDQGGQSQEGDGGGQNNNSNTNGNSSNFSNSRLVTGGLLAGGLAGYLLERNNDKRSHGPASPSKP